MKKNIGIFAILLGCAYASTMYAKSKTIQSEQSSHSTAQQELYGLHYNSLKTIADTGGLYYRRDN